MKIVNVIGNGESRKGFDLNTLSGIVIGCNAIYRDHTPDILCASDQSMCKEIRESDYAGPLYTRPDWNKKFNIDINAIEEEEFNILDKSSRPVDDFIQLLLQYNIDPITSWRDKEPENEKRALRNLYLNAMLQVHPDKDGDRGKEQSVDDYDGRAGFIISAYERYSSAFTGGAKKIQKGGAINNDKLFSAMNTLLNKAIKGYAG